MSLVNDMLRDLDRRKNGASAESVRMVQPRFDAAPKKKKMPLPVFGAIALAGAVLGLIGGYVYFGDKGSNEINDVASLVTQSENIRAAEGSSMRQESLSNEAPLIEEAMSSVLNDIKTTVVNNELNIELYFSTDVDYSVSNPGQGVLNVVLEDAALFSDLDTQIPGDIAGLSLTEIDEGVLLNLETGINTPFDIKKMSSDAGFALLVKVSVEDVKIEPAVLVASASQQTDSLSEISELVDVKTLEENLPAPQLQESSIARTEPQAIRINRELSFEDRDNNISQHSIGLAQRGQLLEAYRSLLEFIEENPEAHKTRETLVTLLISQGENTQAEALVKQGLDLAPENSAFKRLHARIQVANGDKGGALQLLEKLPPLLSMDQEYHDLMASLNQQLGNHSRAVQVYQNLLRVNPDEGRWWVGMGISHEAQGNLNEALGSFQTAINTSSLDDGVRQYSQSRIQDLSR